MPSVLTVRAMHVRKASDGNCPVSACIAVLRVTQVWHSRFSHGVRLCADGVRMVSRQTACHGVTP